MAEVKGRKKIYCEVCNTYISSEPLLDVHNNGKKHQKLLKIREDRKASTERGIYVRGFESNRLTLESDLNEFFSQFGEVTSVFIDKEKAKYAIIEFQCQSEAQEILTSKQLPLFFGKHLIVKKRTFREPARDNSKLSSRSKKQGVTRDQKKSSSFLNEDVLERIKQCPTLDEQVLALVLSTCLTDDDLKLRHLIIQYLQEILVEVFPGCVVTPFGSMTTGLGIKGSDMDLCLLVDPEALHLLLNHDDSVPDCSANSTSQILELIVNILRKFAAGIQNVVSVSTAKCPVVKFIHRDSGLSCDLSINNRLALRNTELIKSYLGLDNRVRPLVIVLKNWSAAKRLTGSGGRQVSNYCLVLMLIHFLQRTHPPVLPVLQLKSENEAILGNATDTENMIIDGWDCSFMSTTVEISENKDSFGVLLKDFFHYYGTSYDYVNEVITIQHEIRQCILKASFESNLSQVSVKSPIFKTSALCVQDPFELSHNLTQSVSTETLGIFTQCCREAYTILSNNPNQPSAFAELFTMPNEAKHRAQKSCYSFTIPYVKKTNFPFTRLQQTCKFIVELLSNLLQISCEVQPVKEEIDSTLNEKTALKLESFTCHNESGEDSMCVDGDTSSDEEFSLASRKRSYGHVKSSEFGAKRVKINNVSPGNSFTFLCKATQMTWQNRRRQRRLQTVHDDASSGTGVCKEEMVEMKGVVSISQQTSQTVEENAQYSLKNIVDISDSSSSSMDVSSSAVKNVEGSTSSTQPLMEFKLTLSERTDEGSNPGKLQECNVVLTCLRGPIEYFANFYAFFKKFVVQHIAECG